MTHGWAGLRVAVVALAASLAGASGVQAAAIQSANTYIKYNAIGNVGSTGITGSGPVIGFNSVTGGSFTAPSSFSLGSFQVAALGANDKTVYDNTPFSIALTILETDGVAPEPNETPFVITGTLKGTITGASQSDVVATFDPIQYGPYRTGSFLNTLSVLDAALSLVPSTTNSGQTTAQARIVVQAVPEPATLMIFAAAVGGLALRRRTRAAR